MSADVSIIAALVEGDRWINADACAVLLGKVKPDGTPNRRWFLENVACLPDFPRKHRISGAWKKSEVMEWADSTRFSRAA